MSQRPLKLQTAGPKLTQKLAAEVVGTFIFVFVGAGSAVATRYLGISDPGSSLLIGALANGIGLAIGISVALAVSGGALNPAVVISLFVSKKMTALEVLPYIVAEVIGATTAVMALIFVAPSSIGNVVGWGAPSLSNSTSVLQGMVLELVMTFFLVLAVYGTIVDGRAPKIAGLGVGLIVVADVLAGGVFTGAAMNPARAIGPMIAGLSFPGYWYIYWVGPILGGILAALVYRNVFEQRTAKSTA